MVNHLSRSLLAMALFSAISSLAGSPVVAYPLFATGVAAIILADVVRTRANKLSRRGVKFGTCLALPGVGLLGGANISLLLIIPVAFSAVLLVESMVRKKKRLTQHSLHGGKDDDPLTNLYISLPSAVALIAVIALA